MFNDMIADGMAKMAQQKEDAIRLVLDEQLGTLWSLTEIAKRCTFVRRAGDPLEYPYLDGKPIMEFHPLESEMVRQDDSYVMRVTQKYRNIG